MEYYFLVLMCSVSFAISIMILFLIFISYTETNATEWIYNLVKIGLLFFTVPILFLTVVFGFFLIKPTYVENIQSDFSIYYKYSFVVTNPHLSNQIFLRILLYLWLLGVLGCMIKLFIDILRFQHGIMQSNIPIHNKEVLCLLNEIKKDLKISQPIIIYYNKLITVPTLILFKKPAILLGDTVFSKQELFFVLKHELTHLKKNILYLKDYV